MQIALYLDAVWIAVNEGKNRKSHLISELPN